jgi:hypothetical protein
MGNLTLPERRYAIFVSATTFKEYAIVVSGKDMETAPKWGGFVRWLGGIRPAINYKLNGKIYNKL